MFLSVVFHEKAEESCFNVDVKGLEWLSGRR
jgi:hypothetical protein